MGDEHVALVLLSEAHTSPMKAVSLPAKRMCSSEPSASRNSRVNTETVIALCYKEVGSLEQHIYILLQVY